MQIRLKLWKIIRWWFHQRNPQNVAIFQNLNHNWTVNWYVFLIPTYSYSCAHINEYTKHACAQTFRNDIIPNLKSRLSINKNWSNSMSNDFIAAFFAPLLNNTHKHVIDKYFVELIAKCFRFKWYRALHGTDTMSGCIRCIILIRICKVRFSIKKRVKRIACWLTLKSSSSSSRVVTYHRVSFKMWCACHGIP